MNVKSSTESELVSFSDYTTSAIHARLSLKAQGYDIETSTLHQENQTTIQKSNHGKASSGKRSRHVDIRYFFMKDRIDKEKC